jgi:hypothetical protein
MYNPGSTIKFTEATGSVDQELLRNEYLAAENRILRAQIKGRLLLSDAEKATLADSVELANLYRLFLSPVGCCIFSALFGTTLNLPCPQLNLHSTRVRRKASRLPSMQSIFSLAMRRE